MGCAEKAEDALYKEELPKKVSVGDVWMNLHQSPPEHGRQLEAASVETQGEGDSLMGRLAMRMTSRDMIDELDLGPKGRNPEAKKAQVADATEFAIPSKIHIEGPALKVGTNIEKEHKDTIDKVKKNPKLSNKKAYEEIAKDHLKEHTKYYDNKIGLPAMEKKLEAQDLSNECPLKMFLGAGLHAQTKDIKASNSSDPIPTEKVRPGYNMAEQARAAGNVFDTMHARDIEQQKSLPKTIFK